MENPPNNQIPPESVTPAGLGLTRAAQTTAAQPIPVTGEVVPKPPATPTGAGRPTERTPEVDRKIEEAAALGASIEEIAYYCGVHRATLYRWIKADEKLRDRIEELQERPILKARQTVINSLDNPDGARWYLERKRKQEFATRSELTGADGSELFKLPPEDQKKLDDLLDGKLTKQPDNTAVVESPGPGESGVGNAGGTDLSVQ